MSHTIDNILRMVAQTDEIDRKILILRRFAYRLECDLAVLKRKENIGVAQIRVDPILNPDILRYEYLYPLIQAAISTTEEITTVTDQKVRIDRLIAELVERRG